MPSTRSKHAVAAVNPGFVLEFKVMTEQIAESLQRDRLMAVLAGAFGVLAARAGGHRTVRRDRLHGGAAAERDRRTHGVGRGSRQRDPAGAARGDDAAGRGSRRSASGWRCGRARRRPSCSSDSSRTMPRPSWRRPYCWLWWLRPPGMFRRAGAPWRAMDPMDAAPAAVASERAPTSSSPPAAWRISRC